MLDNDLHYIRYAVARLSAFSNVWWSMANEWDLIACKGHGIRSSPQSSSTWDRMFEVLRAEDPYTRETSVHNWDGPTAVMYDHSKPWIDHISLQANAQSYREHTTPSIVAGRYGHKPTIWDEVGYEGDLPYEFGDRSGVTMADRFWHGFTLGIYVGHSETILQPSLPDDEQILWWSKGGVLRGASPQRVAWFLQYVRDPANPQPSTLQPMDTSVATGCKSSAAVARGTFALYHIRSIKPCMLRLPGRAHGLVRVTAIHYWEQRKEVLGHVRGVFKTEYGNRGPPRVPYVIEIRALQSGHKA